WDLNRIHDKGYTDNVVDLMVSKLTRLDADAQIAVKQLACLGNSAECQLLEMLDQDSTTAFEAQIAPAVDAGLVLRSKDFYAFLHDRIQEAAYSLIPEDNRAAMHLQLGRLLAAHT